VHPVDGDRVVAGRDDVQPGALQRQQPVSQGLVVMDDVWALGTPTQLLPGPDRERQGLGEGRRTHQQELQDIYR